MRKTRKPIPSEPGAVIDRHGNVTPFFVPVAAGDGGGPSSKGSTTFHYDRHGRLRKMVTPDGSVTTYTWRRRTRPGSEKATALGTPTRKVKPRPPSGDVKQLGVAVVESASSSPSAT